MKKYIIMVSLLVLVITGCKSSKDSIEVAKHCKLTTINEEEKYQLDVEYIIYGQKTIAKKVEIIEKVTASDHSIVEQFSEYLKGTYSKYNELYGGFSNKVTEESGVLVSKTTMDYTKLNLKKYISDNDIIKKYVNKDNEILVDGLVNVYESLGAKCE